MEGDSKSIVDIDSKVSPAVLAGIIGVAPSVLYQYAQHGRVPDPMTEHTYRECIQHLRRFYAKNEGVKLEAKRFEYEVEMEKQRVAALVASNKKEDLETKKLLAQQERDRKLAEREEEREFIRQQKELDRKQAKQDALDLAEATKVKAKLAQEARLHQMELDKELKRNEALSNDAPIRREEDSILNAKLMQDIRLGRAKEQQVWVRTAVERGLYLDNQELLLLTEPLLVMIRQSLVDLGNVSEDAQKVVDQVMETLYTLGLVITEKAEEDSEKFITTIMNTDIDIEKIDINSDIEPIL